MCAFSSFVIVRVPVSVKAILWQWIHSRNCKIPRLTFHQSCVLAPNEWTLAAAPYSREVYTHTFNTAQISSWIHEIIIGQIACLITLTRCERVFIAIAASYILVRNLSCNAMLVMGNIQRSRFVFRMNSNDKNVSSLTHQQIGFVFIINKHLWFIINIALVIYCRLYLEFLFYTDPRGSFGLHILSIFSKKCVILLMCFKHATTATN